jgi:glycosyltransferase involved in cell wall biosynthesis
VTQLLSGFDRARVQPELVLLQRRGEFLDQLPADLRVYDLAHAGRVTVARTLTRLAHLVRQRRPEAVLSFQRSVNLANVLVCRATAYAGKVVLGAQVNLTASLRRARIRRLRTWCHRRLYRRADGVIACSGGVREDLVRAIGVPAARTRVIYNACDVERVRRLSRLEPDLALEWNTPTIVTVGRLVRQKGLPVLLDAFAQVARRRSCQLVMLGDGEERAALARQAARLGIADRVVMPGFRRNPFAVMARGRAFVLSSLWEGFGTVLIEAMACGVPVVSTDCPSGPREILADGQAGVLVPPGDSGALASAIVQALEDEPLRDRLTRAAARRVEAFTTQAMVRGYEAALAEILAEPR